MIKPRKTYTSCSDLPVHNFIKLIVKNELKYLYAESKSLLTKNISNLQEIWENIFEEYTSISKSTTAAQLLSIHREIVYVNSKLYLIESLVTFLEREYNPQVVQLLKKQGFNYPYTELTLANDLKLTRSNAKKLTMRILKAEIELSKIDTGEGASEQDYIQLLTELGKYQNARLDPKQVTVAEFVAIMNRFQRDNKPKTTTDGR